MRTLHKKHGLFFLIVSLCTFISGCSLNPSAGDGKQAIQNRISQDAQSRINLNSFRKTNGQLAEVAGVKVYSLEFEAEIEFTENCKWLVGQIGGQIGFQTAQPPSQHLNGMAQFAEDTLNPGNIMKQGQRIMITGVIHFEKKENGWSVDGIDISRATPVTGSENTSSQTTQREARGYKSKEERIACISNMKMINIAIMMTKMAHGSEHFGEYSFRISTNAGGTLELCAPGPDGFDMNSALHFRAMSNELKKTEILVCPSDSSKKPALNFQSLQPNNCSYEIRTDVDVNNPKAIIVRDPVHNIVGHVDGTVEQLSTP